MTALRRLTLDEVTAPDGPNHMIRSEVDGVPYIGTRFLVVREDAVSIHGVVSDVGELGYAAQAASSIPLAQALDATPHPGSPDFGIHPYFRWLLVNVHHMGLQAGAPVLGDRPRWLIYDADTFVGVVAGLREDFAVQPYTSLALTKHIAEELRPISTCHHIDPLQVWRTARRIELLTAEEWT